MAAFALALALGAGEAARACSCAGTPTPRASFERAAAVFVGVVTKAEPDEKEDGEQVVRVRVEEAFKGAATGEEIVLRQPGHNCAPKYKAGERALLYVHLHAETKTWEVYGCDRSGALEQTPDDLLYLRALPGSATRSRLSGVLHHYEDGPDQSFSLVRNVAGARVKIFGEKKTYEVVTDSNGVYELYDLPPGVYAIRPELPYGLKVRFPMPFGERAESEVDGAVAVQLGEGGMAGSDFILGSDNVISGRVLDPQGNPMRDVCLELLSAEKAAPEGVPGRIFDCTDEGGRYSLEDVPPGRYLIAANDKDRPTGREPFPRTFYPGVLDRARAGVVAVGATQERAEGYDISLPKLLPTVEVSGRLLYRDGRPVVGERVSFRQGGVLSGGDGAMTDGEGRFAFRVLKGMAGTVGADVYVYEAKFATPCPDVSKILKEAEANAAYVETPPLRLAGDADATDLELFLPLSSCPLARGGND